MDINLEYMTKAELLKLSKEVLVDKILSLKEENTRLIDETNQNSMINSEIQKYKSLEPIIKELYDPLMKILKFFSTNNISSKNKGYNLSKVPNKKYGFLYYVRYIKNGKLIPSRWNTNTNDLEKAKLFAVDNKLRILEEYYRKKNETGSFGNMYNILKNFYSQESKFMKLFGQLNRPINERSRIYYYNIIAKEFIPFLKRNEINASIIGKFQFYLIEKGKSPQRVVKYLKIIEIMFSFLLMMGIIEKNVFENVIKIRINELKKT